MRFSAINVFMPPCPNPLGITNKREVKTMNIFFMFFMAGKGREHGREDQDLRRSALAAVIRNSPCTAIKECYS